MLLVVGSGDTGGGENQLDQRLVACAATLDIAADRRADLGIPAHIHLALALNRCRALCSNWLGLSRSLQRSDGGVEGGTVGRVGDGVAQGTQGDELGGRVGHRRTIMLGGPSMTARSILSLE